MRVLYRIDPRWIALLLVPALLAAGAAQPPEVVPRASALVGQKGPALLRSGMPQVIAAVLAEPAPGPAAVAMHDAIAAVTARREARASREADSEEPGRAPLTLQQRGRSALRALAYDPASLGYAIRFVPYRGGELGTTNRRSKLITIYVRPGQSELTLRVTIAHELGHALDFVHGSPERRSAYREVRRLPAGPWFPCDRCSDFASPAGDFAEVFAMWLAGPGDFRSRLAGPPSAAQLRELAPLFAVPAKTVQARPSAVPSPSASPTKEEPRKGLPNLLGPPPSPGPGRR